MRPNDARPRVDGATRAVSRHIAASSTAAELVHRAGDPELALLLPHTLCVADLLAEARWQADLAGHPYIDHTHLALAAARVAHRRDLWALRRQRLAPPWTTPPRRPWHPRGRHSAARTEAVADLLARHRHAVTVHATPPW